MDFLGTWVVYQNVKNAEWFKMTVLQEEYRCQGAEFH